MAQEQWGMWCSWESGQRFSRLPAGADSRSTCPEEAPQRSKAGQTQGQVREPPSSASPHPLLVTARVSATEQGDGCGCGHSACCPSVGPFQARGLV